MVVLSSAGMPAFAWPRPFCVLVGVLLQIPMLYRCLPELEMPFVKFMSFLTSLTLNRVDVVVIDVFRECLDLMLAEFSLRAAEDSSLCKCKCVFVCVCVSILVELSV